MLDWLLMPLDPSRSHAIDVYTAWHGRLMVLAWAILFPLGITLARFFKITPRQRWPEQLDNKTWWFGHLALQYAGGAAIIGSIALIWVSPARSSSALPLHAWLGWAAIAFCSSQFVGGWLRGSKGGPTSPAADGSFAGDHFDMTRRRRTFEYLHKTFGYVAITLACAVVVNGLWLVNAPRWMWLALALWWIVLAATWVSLQRRGRAIDTYQAIWGPSLDLPGNHLKPIGIGVHRHPPPSQPGA
jgi:Eukaryotic cytochrome b561